MNRCRCHDIVALILGATASAALSRADVSPAPMASGEPAFSVLTEAELIRPASGLLMTCPSHRHGTPEEARAKLLELLSENQSESPGTAWVCRADTMKTLEWVSPIAERVIVNPFVMHGAGDESPRRPSVWRGAASRVLENVEEVRRASGDAPLLGCIDVKGEGGLFGTRGASFAELEWQALAVCGSGFQGIVWRQRPGVTTDSRRLTALSSRLKANGGIASARPVTWASAEGGVHVSAIRNAKQLFVVLLSPDYMKVTPGNRSVAVLPLESSERRGRVTLDVPSGLEVKLGRAWDGSVLKVQKQGAQLQCDYRFEGGGQLFAFDLSGSAEGDIGGVAIRPVPRRVAPNRQGQAGTATRGATAPIELPED